MKLLFLASSGQIDEPEDVGLINLFFASLKKHVLPYFDAKVILYTSCRINPATGSLFQQRANEFGLQDVVTVMTERDFVGIPPGKIEEIILPPKANKQHWPIHNFMINTQFDYAKKFDFFGADWIIHIDTDLEFLPDFASDFLKVNEMRAITPAIMVTLSGDSGPDFFMHKDKTYILKFNRRSTLYDPAAHSDQFAAQIEEQSSGNGFRPFQDDDIHFMLGKVAIRNDFIAISREATLNYNYNWSYSNFEPYCPVSGDTEETAAFKRLWREKVSGVQIHLNRDKGTQTLNEFQAGWMNVMKIQLRHQDDLIRHYPCGWTDPVYKNVSRARLEADYQDTQAIWQADYEGIEPQELDKSRFQ